MIDLALFEAPGAPRDALDAFYRDGWILVTGSTCDCPLEELAQGGQATIDRRRRAALGGLEEGLVVADVGRRDRGRGKLFARRISKPAGKAHEIGAVVDDGLLRRLLAGELGEESRQIGVGDGCGARERHRIGLSVE
jgi:hypothetical protein